MALFKRHFHSYRQKEYDNNTLLAYRKIETGTFEVIAWQRHFEVYYRLTAKRYGHLIQSFDTLEEATNCMKSITLNQALLKHDDLRRTQRDTYIYHAIKKGDIE